LDAPLGKRGLPPQFRAGRSNLRIAQNPPTPRSRPGRDAFLPPCHTNRPWPQGWPSTYFMRRVKKTLWHLAWTPRSGNADCPRSSARGLGFCLGSPGRVLTADSGPNPDADSEIGNSKRPERPWGDPPTSLARDGALPNNRHLDNISTLDGSYECRLGHGAAPAGGNDLLPVSLTIF